MAARRSHPSGQPTRGKTALNRLRQVDSYIALAHSAMLTSGTPLVVDLGYGAQAWTALEMFERWQRFNPHLRLLGVELDPERVAAAQPFEQPGAVAFRLGGFNLLDVLGTERARIIRVYNVLSQYDEAVVADALQMIAAALEPGGILIEGTSNPTGSLVVFDVYRRSGGGALTHEELVFGTRFRAPLDPLLFQAVLPKRLIQHVYDDVPAALFDAWKRPLLLARGAGRSTPRPAWAYAVRLLHEKYGFPVDPRRTILRRGYLALRVSLTHE